jgi:uncharacterized membrane protein
MAIIVGIVAAIIILVATLIVFVLSTDKEREWSFGSCCGLMFVAIIFAIVGVFGS